MLVAVSQVAKLPPPPALLVLTACMTRRNSQQFVTTLILVTLVRLVGAAVSCSSALFVLSRLRSHHCDVSQRDKSGHASLRADDVT